MELTRILCPVDYSDESRHAVEHALAFSRLYGGQVTLFHVYSGPPPTVALSELPANAPVFTPADPAQVAKEVRTFAGPLMEAPTAPAIVVREGHPVKEIVKQAESMPADLLVMGTHGRGGFERLLLGSVTEKVIRKVRCPVLTVPPPTVHPRKGPVLFNTILCPVDFSTSSRHALSHALSLARETGARLVLLHVVEHFLAEGFHGEASHFTVPEFQQHLQREAAEHLSRIVPEEERSWCTPDERIASGKAWREILKVATEVSAELIVMGVHGHGPVDLALFGSTTNHVIRAASCPVLTLRG
jgi:nucleotide-binding universal stress UspA family protein